MRQFLVGVQRSQGVEYLMTDAARVAFATAIAFHLYPHLIGTPLDDTAVVILFHMLFQLIPAVENLIFKYIFFSISF